jgi:hypothetical protein
VRGRSVVDGDMSRLRRDGSGVGGPTTATGLAATRLSSGQRIHRLELQQRRLWVDAGLDGGAGVMGSTAMEWRGEVVR